jgi:pimeloyl-ACP methyl ester carboxylesterase
MAPQRRFACRLLSLAPWLIPFLAGAMGRRLARDPEGVFSYLLARVPEPDRETLAKPENRALLQASFTEAIRCSSAGIASDALLYLSEWDFAPHAIGVPVTLWHGERDETVPASMSRELAEAIPQARLKLFPEEGHYSLPFQYYREILESALT